MLRAIALAGFMALMLPALAVAQQQHQGQKGGAPRGAPHGPPGGVAHGPPGGGAPHGMPGGAQHARPAFVPGGPMAHGPGPGGPPHARPGFVPGPHLGPVGGPPHMGPGDRPQFGYHGHFFNPVRVSPFIYPQGYGYRRWAVGAVLPPLFLAPNYYYTDWSTLGLDPPPPGAQWVRYGPDLLMVDIATGSVIEVVPDVFYE